jgi:hypothetical protein
MLVVQETLHQLLHHKEILEEQDMLLLPIVQVAGAVAQLLLEEMQLLFKVVLVVLVFKFLLHSEILHQQ